MTRHHLPACCDNTNELLDCAQSSEAVLANAQVVRYCSKQCQQLHWSRHKIYCSSIRTDAAGQEAASSSTPAEAGQANSSPPCANGTCSEPGSLQCTRRQVTGCFGCYEMIASLGHRSCPFFVADALMPSDEQAS